MQIFADLIDEFIDLSMHDLITKFFSFGKITLLETSQHSFVFSTI